MHESSCGEIVNFSFIGGGNGSMSRGESCFTWSITQPIIADTLGA
jgi:hypothetical protein